MYLDIEHRRAIHRVQPNDIQHVALDTLDTGRGHADRVGAAGAAGGEHATEWAVGIPPGMQTQVVANRVVEIEKHNDVAAGFKAQQALAQRRIEHDAGRTGTQFVARESPISTISLHMADGMKNDG